MIAKLIGNEVSMGTCLTSLLSNTDYKRLKMMIAFAKQSAIGRINVNLMNFRNSGGRLEVIVGIDHRITTFQAIEQLKQLSDNNIYIHYDRGSVDFHPKLYIFEGDANRKVILLGSSNLTAGGLYTNYEANVLLTSTTISERDIVFFNEVGSYYNSIKGDTNTRRATGQLLKLLYQQGLIIDETSGRSFNNIINNLSNIPFRSRRRGRVPAFTSPLQELQPQLPTKFGMLLSGFDVSPRSLDPVVLVPLKALKQYPLFWEWPSLFTLSGAGYPERYTTAIVNLPTGLPQRLHIRLYYYDRKREFRLQCEPIKRNGARGDMVTIEKINSRRTEYEINLIRHGTNEYRNWRRICTTRVSRQKCFGYD